MKFEKLKMKLAYMLPRDVAMWAAVRVGAHATTGQFGSQVVPDLLFMDALKRWDTPHPPPQHGTGTKRTLKQIITDLFMPRILFRGGLALTIDATAHAGLAEPLKALYKAEGAGFKLDVDGIEDPAPLKGALEKERKARAEADKKLREQADHFKDIDPVKYRELMSRLGDNEEAELIKAGKIDEVVAKRTAKQQAAHEKALKEASDRADGAMEVATTYMDRVLDNHVRAAASKAGLQPTAVEDALFRARSMFSLDDEGNPVQFDKDGTTVIMGKDGKTPFGPAEWLEGMKETAPHWYPASGSGGGAGGGKGKDGKPVVNRTQFAAKNPAEQAAYIKEGGTVVD